MIEKAKRIFAVILARNEEKNIGEISPRARVFVDRHSLDNTRSIAE